MAKKIDYTKSPALAFIDTPSQEEETITAPAAETTKSPELKGGKLSPTRFKPEEKRTKRVQLILRPSIYEKAKSRADSLSISFNEYVNALIDLDISEGNE